MSTVDLIRSIVNRLVGDRLDYLAMYPARVVEQRNGLLDVQPDDARLPAMQSVPIRYGVPGVVAEVEPAARVLIGFEAGDPARPVATLWDASRATIRFNGRSAGVARVGDEVRVTIPAGTVICTVAEGVGTVDTSVEVTGTITEGAEDVFA